MGDIQVIGTTTTKQTNKHKHKKTKNTMRRGVPILDCVEPTGDCRKKRRKKHNNNTKDKFKKSHIKKQDKDHNEERSADPGLWGTYRWLAHNKIKHTHQHRKMKKRNIQTNKKQNTKQKEERSADPGFWETYRWLATSRLLALKR